MKKATIFFLSLFFTTVIVAQQPFPFWNDIRKFKTQDSTAFPKEKQILFIGSSSFTNWQDVNDYFPGYKILNRAFGGSTLVDLIRYRYEVIFPYNPRQIVMYCGENDFAASDTVTVDMVVARFKTLYTMIRQKYPAVPFAYVSMKPSPSRKHLMPKYTEANRQIKAFLQTQKQSKFIDTYSLMLKNGALIADIFIEDRLHMNRKGYEIWQKAMKPYLLKSANTQK